MRRKRVKHKKDILFLCQFFYPEYISSATLPFDTAAALKKAGFSVDVLCGYPREYSASENVPVTEEIDGIRIRRLKYQDHHDQRQVSHKAPPFKYSRIWAALVSGFAFGITFSIMPCSSIM